MDSNTFHEIDAIKLEKQKALQRYNTLKKISNIVQKLEIFVAILLILYSLSVFKVYAPAAVEVLKGFVTKASTLFLSPHFVFLIGNVIIVTLFAKSSAEMKAESSDDDVEVFRQVTENVVGSSATVGASDDGDDDVSAVVVEEEKEVDEKSYRRTKSSSEMKVAVVDKAVVVEEKKELLRSATELRRSEKPPANEAKSKREKIVRFEEMSNEEFNKKVEAFIKKQQRLLREESLAVVISN